MEDFIEYVTKYKPDFRTCIRGATAQEIEKLEEYAKYPLPSSYKSFLNYMGQDGCGIRLSGDGTSDIQFILTTYEEFISTSEWDIPGGCILVGLGTLTPNVCLKLEGDKDPPLVFTTPTTISDLYAESLYKLIYRDAFVIYRTKVFPHRAYLTSSYEDIGRKNLVEPAFEIAQSLGFEKHWFSDAIQVCGEREGAAIYINQFEQQGIAIGICGEENSDIQNIGDAFIRGIGVKRYQ
jgi:hypothetical protein